MYSKELLKGTLSAIILKLLAEKGRMYGYEMFQTVSGLTDGKIILKDGSLYPALQRLTADGTLTFKEEKVGNRIRKYYCLTKKGQKDKVNSVNELKEFIATLNKVVFPETKMI